MRILIRADATHGIGTGHVMRSLALGASLVSQGDAVDLVSPGLTSVLIAKAHEYGMGYRAVLGSADGSLDPAAFFQLITDEKPDWVILDGYHFKTEIQRQIKHLGVKLLCIDDIADCHYVSDLVLNQNAGAEVNAAYSVSPETTLLLGSEYVLLRPEFISSNRNRIFAPLAFRILVSLGGSDPDNFTSKVIEGLENTSGKVEGRIIVGSYNIHYDDLADALESSSKQLSLLRHPSSMAEQMKWCDLAIVAAGSVVWELAYLSTPMVVGTSAENQVPIAAELAMRKAAHNVGWWRDVTVKELALTVDSLLESQERRCSLGQEASKFSDGRGCERVRKAMMERSASC